MNRNVFSDYQNNVIVIVADLFEFVHKTQITMHFCNTLTVEHAIRVTFLKLHYINFTVIFTCNYPVL